MHRTDAIVSPLLVSQCRFRFIPPDLRLGETETGFKIQLGNTLQLNTCIKTQKWSMTWTCRDVCSLNQAHSVSLGITGRLLQSAHSSHSLGFQSGSVWTHHGCSIKGRELQISTCWDLIRLLQEIIHSLLFRNIAIQQLNPVWSFSNPQTRQKWTADTSAVSFLASSVDEVGDSLLNRNTLIPECLCASLWTVNIKRRHRQRENVVMWKINQIEKETDRERENI